MSGDIGRKMESRIDAKLIAKASKGKPFDGFKGNKVMGEVLDRITVHTLYDMISSRVMAYVNGPVSAGKESVVFWAVDGDGRDVALKVYLVATSNFKRRLPYIQGDPRFSRIRKGTRNLVNLWAKKECANLERCVGCGLPVPKPICVSGNVLAMEFIGVGGAPARTLLESKVSLDDYTEAIGIINKLYRDAKLVHGDLSPYNIFKTDGGLVVFDLGSAVDLRHPGSAGFLERDIRNMTDFFAKRGLTVEDPADILRGVTG